MTAPQLEPNARIRRGVYVAMGANLAQPIEQMRRAVHAIEQLPGTEVIARSSLYRTAPVGETEQPDFINAVIELRTALEPKELLSHLHAIERAAGRVRGRARNGPRELDLDLLLDGDRVLACDALHLPHPRMHQRAFVLVPLCEIAPHLVVPGVGRAMDCLQRHGGSGVERLQDEPW